ncbi:MAG: hypothetical protein HY257_06105, partial [Chloroflexi bacterium]|nr:hypothetical protein [Chloroflexota bacterium]
MRQNKFTDYAPRADVIAIFLLIIFLSAACGTATPTTARPIATAPLVLATSAPPPPVIIPTSVISPTIAITGTRATATVAVTTTRAAPAIPTRTPTPKPATLSGRIAFDVVTAEGAQFHQVHTANVDGTNAHQILTGATFGTLSLDGARVAFFSVAGSGRNEGAYVADSN